MESVFQSKTQQDDRLGHYYTRFLGDTSTRNGCTSGFNSKRRKRYVCFIWMRKHEQAFPTGRNGSPWLLCDLLTTNTGYEGYLAQRWNSRHSVDMASRDVDKVHVPIYLSTYLSFCTSMQFKPHLGTGSMYPLGVHTRQ